MAKSKGYNYQVSYLLGGQDMVLVLALPAGFQQVQVLRGTLQRMSSGRAEEEVHMFATGMWCGWVYSQTVGVPYGDRASERHQQLADVTVEQRLSEIGKSKEVTLVWET